MSSRTGPQTSSEEAWPAARRMSAHPGENLFDMERLGDVVIGSGVNAGDLVAPAVAGGEDENRHGLAGRTPFFDDGNAIQLRQADIENDRVIGLGIAEIMPFLAVECLIDNITGFFQRIGQLPIEIGIVLNNENTHYQPFPSVPARARVGHAKCFGLFSDISAMRASYIGTRIVTLRGRSPLPWTRTVTTQD